jgi:ADP-ribose pyrophosphatase YjhB (NUDIX family)
MNPFFYLGENPTVDIIIINHKREILLIKRSEKSNACPSMYAFPGGFIDSNSPENSFWQGDLETPMQAALRELKEETNLELEINTELNFIGEYVGNKRDPRDNETSWSKTYAFYYEIEKQLFIQQKDIIRGMDDAVDAKWFSINEIQKMPLAFDHNIIFKDFLSILQKI